MKCYKKRTIFDFFKYSDCKKCKYYNEDSEMHIGNVSIYLYYLRKCNHIIIDLDYLFSFSKEVKLFLKDSILNNDKIIPLILEKEVIFNNFNLSECLFSFEIDIHILII